VGPNGVGDPHGGGCLRCGGSHLESVLREVARHAVSPNGVVIDDHDGNHRRLLVAVLSETRARLVSLWLPGSAAGDVVGGSPSRRLTLPARRCFTTATISPFSCWYRHPDLPFGPGIGRG